jgi:hypothetical protein
MHRWLLGFAVLAVGLGFTSPAPADLIINGGFESGSLTPGWTGGNSVSSSGAFGIPSHSGNFYLAFGAVGGDDRTSQTVTDVVGQVYDLRFFYFRDGSTPSDLNVYFDAGPVFTGLHPVYSEVNSPAHPYVQHDILVTGTGQDTVTFGARNDPAFDGLDDVSLVAQASAVPEPAGLTLLGLSIAAAAGYQWRKRRSRKASSNP